MVGVAVGEVVGGAVGDVVGAAVGEAVREAVGADLSRRGEEKLKSMGEWWVVVWGGGMVDKDTM